MSYQQKIEELEKERAQLKAESEALKLGRAALETEIDRLNAMLLRPKEGLGEQKWLSADEVREIREKISDATRRAQNCHEEISGIRQEIISINNRITAIDTMIKANPPARDWSRCHGCIIGLRKFGSMRRNVILLARKNGAYGTILVADDGNDRKNVSVDVYFEQLSFSNQFMDGLQDLANWYLQITVNIECEMTQKPDDVRPVPLPNKEDDSLDDSVSVSSVQSVISKLPPLIPDVSLFPNDGVVVHLVPRALFPGVSNSQAPWMVLGGPPQLNRLTDLDLPIEITLESTFDEGNHHVLVLACDCYQAQDWACLQVTCKGALRTGDCTGTIRIEYPSQYLEKFISVLEWRAESLQRARELQQKGCLGPTNGKGKHRPWYRVVAVPPEIEPAPASQAILQRRRPRTEDAHVDDPTPAADDDPTPAADDDPTPAVVWEEPDT